MKVYMKGIKVRETKDAHDCVIGCEVVTEDWKEAVEIHAAIKKKLLHMLQGQQTLSEE